MQAAVSVFLFCCMFCSCGFRCGDAIHAMLSYSFVTSMQITMRHHHFPHMPSHIASPPLNLAMSPSEAPLVGHVTPKSAIPVPAPSILIPAGAPSPKFHDSSPGPKHHVIRNHEKGRYAHSPSTDGSDSAPSPKHHHHHQKRQHAHAPSIDGQDCINLFCSDPLTTTPIGSPCGCVLPLKVELDLGVAPFLVFTVVPELEVEVADGTYVKQSQVRIMSAVASGLEKTRVDIDLLPLGDKFDNMTAFLIYERFWQKKVPINATVFGDYDVIYIRYPGLPSSPPSIPKAVPPGANQLPFTAYVPPGKTRKINPRAIAMITSSSFIFLLLCIAIVWILSKVRKVGKPSTFEYPRFTSSVAKRSGMRSMISDSLASSASLSLISTMPTCPSSVKSFTLAELDKATEKFNSKKILGEGGFGRVYHGILEDGIEVAVKLLTRENQNGDREFIAEIEMLSRLHHRNLVKLIGICIEGYTRCLVYELVRNGSVESHLHGVDKKRGSLNWDARMKIALGAARGLAYLHEDSNPRVIHRDFKASNVLLEEDFTPKVSDFGLAREASDGSHHISTTVMGTFGYVAPEYAMTGHLLVKSDVYSYGVVLLELLSGRKPVDMSQPQGQENLVTWARPLLTSKEGLDLLIDPSLGGNYNFDNMARVAAIASMCVHPEVSQRPFMGEVVQALKLIYNDTNEACEDTCSQREESSVPDGDFRGETGTGSSWWNTGTPHLTFGYASSFITMEYSSGPLDEIDRPHSTSSLVGRAESLTSLNRSGPLRTARHKSTLARLRGSMSEHELLSRRFAMDRYWV